MKVRIAALAALCGTATTAIAGNVEIPIAAPTLSEWGLVGLGMVVAVAAGITVRRRK